MKIKCLSIIAIFAMAFTATVSGQPPIVQMGDTMSCQAAPCAASSWRPNLGGLRNAGCGSSSTYFSLFGGGTTYNDFETSTLDIDTDLIGSFTGEASLDLNEGWAAGTALGRRLSNRFRSEFEFTFRNATLESGTLEGVGTGGGPAVPLPPVEIPGVGIFPVPPIELPGLGDLPTGTLPVQGRLNSYSLMTNLLMDLNPGGRATIYAGGGVGVNLNSLELNEPVNQIDVQVRNSTFAYQGIVGITKPLTPGAEMFVEYRYFGTDKQSLNATTPLGTLSTEADANGHNYFVGLRFNRW